MVDDVEGGGMTESESRVVMVDNITTKRHASLSLSMFVQICEEKEINKYLLSSLNNISM